MAGKLNYELNSRHDIVISASDLGGKSYVAKFTIAVQDVNDPPTVRNLTFVF